jgi:hypothetical protein
VLKSLAWASRVSWVVEDFNSTRKALFLSTNFGEGIELNNFILELPLIVRGKQIVEKKITHFNSI